MTRSLPLGFLAVVVMVAAGCGGNSPFDYQPVSGKIVYEDGQPLPASDIILRFTAQIESPDGESFPRVATAHADATGAFEVVTSYKYGDGLIPAKHKVVVELDPAAGGKPMVPKEYTSIASTPLIVDSTDADFIEIKVPRP